jgi:hypothetical protein
MKNTMEVARHVKIDFSVLDKLGEGNPNFKSQILVLLRAQAEELLQSLQNPKDLKPQADQVHKFKSSVYTVSPKGYELMHRLESILNGSSPAVNLEARLAEAKNFCEDLMRSIEQELA